MGRLRIVAGGLGGRRIDVPAGDRVRPTPERVREALFSILGERVHGATVLDLFAGSGALGLEALSRGAARAVFVESAPRVVAVLRSNVESLGVGERCRIVGGAVETAVERLLGAESFDLILADPPYASDERGLLERLVARSRLRVGGRLVVERATGRGFPDTPPTGLSHLRTAVYGDSRLDFYAGDPA